MINITLIGASGRMGKEIIRQLINDEDTQLVGAIESPGSTAIGEDAGTNSGERPLNVVISDDFGQLNHGTDVVIDFSSPNSIPRYAPLATEYNLGIVIGTTGLTDKEHEILETAVEKGSRIVLAPNMSIGVNLLFELARLAATILDQDYDIEIVEMHHRRKLDAPSGTAVRLGEILASARDLSYSNDVLHGREGMVGQRTSQEIGMHSMRGGDVVGDHTVIFAGEGERIELTHKASSRSTFAKGAVEAAKFIHSAKRGLYDMKNVLNLGKVTE